MFGPEIPFFSKKCLRFGFLLHSGDCKPDLTLVTVFLNPSPDSEISHPKLLDFLESLMQDLNYNIRAFQKFSFILNFFGVKCTWKFSWNEIFLRGPLLKRMSAGFGIRLQPLSFPMSTPNRKRTLEVFPGPKQFIIASKEDLLRKFILELEKQALRRCSVGNSPLKANFGLI